MFETVYRDSLSRLVELFQHEPLRGEYVVVIEGMLKGGEIRESGKTAKD